MSRHVQQFPVWALFDATRRWHTAPKRAPMPLIRNLDIESDLTANAKQPLTMHKSREYSA